VPIRSRFLLSACGCLSSRAPPSNKICRGREEGFHHNTHLLAYDVHGHGRRGLPPPPPPDRPNIGRCHHQFSCHNFFPFDRTLTFLPFLLTIHSVVVEVWVVVRRAVLWVAGVNVVPRERSSSSLLDNPTPSVVGGGE
jgi:hypothetical protein